MTTITTPDPAPTLDDVWRLFRENAMQMRESERRFQETEHFLKEQAQETERFLKEQAQETERFLKEQAQENERKAQESERFLKEQAQESERKSQETDRKFQETEKLLREQAIKTDHAINAVNKSIGQLSDRLGDFIEEAVRPAAVRLFNDLGIEVHEVHPNVSVNRGQEGLEIDLLVINEQEAVVIECKSKLSQNHVDDHLERLDKFKRLMPRYATMRVVGAVAAMVIPEQVAAYAYRQGLYVIGQNGDGLVIRNDAKFIPKTW